MGANNAIGNVFGAIAKGGPLAVVGAKKAKSALVPEAVAAPDVPDPVDMPDPLEQQKAKQRSLIEQLSRRGRSSTILTNQGGSKLGG